MKTIAFLNQKGGVGKTNLATNVAGSLARTQIAGKGDARVLLVDADPQGSSLDWSNARQSPSTFNVVSMPRPILHKELPALGRDFDFVIVDGPPRQDALAKSVIMAADLVVVPVQPSPYDVWASQQTVTLIEECAVFKETQKSVFALNRKIVNTAIGRDVTETLARYESMTILASHICQRVIFAESAAQGLTATELDPKSEAAAEILALSSEIFLTLRDS